MILRMQPPTMDELVNLLSQHSSGYLYLVLTITHLFFLTKYYFFKSIKAEKLLLLTISAFTQTISIVSVTSLVDAVYTARILTVFSIGPDTFLKYYVKILVVCYNVLLNIVCFLTITWWIGWCIATYILLEIKFKKLNSYIIIITFCTIIIHPACLTGT